GAVAVIVESSTTVKEAATPPKSTSYAAEKPSPVIVTAFPPSMGPLPGEMPETAGGSTYVNAPAAVVDPTATSNVPAAPGGSSAVIEVSLLTTNCADT